MITVTNHREEIAGYAYDDIVVEKSLVDAAVQLIESELGFNGTIINVTECSITTKVHILSKIDTTTFHGPKEEMNFLHYLTKMWLLSYKEDNTEYADLVVNLCKGKPLYVTRFGDMIIGNVKKNKFMYILVIGLFNIEDPSIYKKDLFALSLKDVLAVYDLFNQGYSLTNCLTLIN